MAFESESVDYENFVRDRRNVKFIPPKLFLDVRTEIEKSYNFRSLKSKNTLPLLENSRTEKRDIFNSQEYQKKIFNNQSFYVYVYNQGGKSKI